MEDLSYLLEDLFCTSSHSLSQFYCLLERHYLVIWRVFWSTRRSLLYQFTFPVTVLLSITEKMSCLWKSCLIYWLICTNSHSLSQFYCLLQRQCPVNGIVVWSTRRSVLYQFTFPFTVLLSIKETMVCGSVVLPSRPSVLYQFTILVTILLSITEQCPVYVKELSYLLKHLFCTNSHSLSQFYCLLQRHCLVYGRLVWSTRRSVMYQFTFPVIVLLSITETMTCLWESFQIFWKICSVPIHIPCDNSLVYYRDNVLSIEELSYLLEYLFCTSALSLSQFCCLL